MGGDNDEWVKEDGGWEDMVDEGHPLAEYMLDTPHPYDLHGYKPADRWGTRQEIMPRRFADPAGFLDEGTQPTSGSGITSRVRSRVPRKPPGRGAAKPAKTVTSTPASGASPPKTLPSQQVPAARPIGRRLKAASRLGVGPLSDKAKGQLMRSRATVVATELGMDTEDVAAVVRCGLSADNIARRLGLVAKDVKAIRSAYSRACSEVVMIRPAATGRPSKAPQGSVRKKVPRPKRTRAASPNAGRPNPKLRSNPPVHTVVKRPLVVPPIGVCPSCDGPIGPNDRCQCS